MDQMPQQIRSLQIVKPSFRAPRARFPVPAVTEGKVNLICLDGGQCSPWRELGREAREVRVEISYNPTSQIYIARIFKGAELIDLREGREHERRDLTLWFECAANADLRVRVPWSKIKAGEVFTCAVVMRDIFFELRHLATIRRENEKRLSVTLLG